jgi:hypothetical protein
MKLAIQPHLLRRLKMSGSKHALPYMPSWIVQKIFYLHLHTTRGTYSRLFIYITCSYWKAKDQSTPSNFLSPADGEWVSFLPHMSTLLICYPLFGPSKFFHSFYSDLSKTFFDDDSTLWDVHLNSLSKKLFQSKCTQQLIQFLEDIQLCYRTEIR